MCSGDVQRYKYTLYNNIVTQCYYRCSNGKVYDVVGSTAVNSSGDTRCALTWWRGRCRLREEEGHLKCRKIISRLRKTRARASPPCVVVWTRFFSRRSFRVASSGWWMTVNFPLTPVLVTATSTLYVHHCFISSSPPLVSYTLLSVHTHTHTYIHLSLSERARVCVYNNIWDFFCFFFFWNFTLYYFFFTPFVCFNARDRCSGIK